MRKPPELYEEEFHFWIKAIFNYQMLGGQLCLMYQLYNLPDKLGVRLTLRYLNVRIERVNQTDYCREKTLQDLCMTESLRKESASMWIAVNDLEK